MVEQGYITKAASRPNLDRLPVSALEEELGGNGTADKIMNDGGEVTSDRRGGSR